MRCIEIAMGGNMVNMGGGINRNMRCIEMLGYSFEEAITKRLIETWDVLKYCTRP